MRILVDANVPGAEACFGPLGELVRMPGREIDAAALCDIDALVIRSITRLDAATLDTAGAQGMRLRFVGTCTIGTDHVDRAALARHGIAFASAPGCNAEAVVDYVLGSLLTLAERQGWRLSERRVGIVGVGNVGGRLLARLSAMGIACLACDPPRAEVEGLEGFETLETLIGECDVLCLHTPLVREGPHATHHLLDARRIAELAPGTLLLNAGRGDCIDGQALRQRLAGQGDISAVLDVWEGEPAIDPALRDLAQIATPHIAGYSLDGKLRGTYQIYAALYQHLGLPRRLGLADLLPPPPLTRLRLQGGLDPDEALRCCLRAVYDVRRDHDSLRRESRRRGMAQGFDACRANYPLRRELSTLTVELGDGAQALAPWLLGAGLNLA
ncbi:4-phosphoerythronate dehydrogenase PdxB [Halomonas sp. MCCC 1A17488]|uniref:4-phosphoerythronate dehydrogenase PdxB n=1 Tax=unclassified Halomonas TaxID=2609666 RepID=UPI0018D2501E|nr:4-phosphoerythronate dehydrogenase PdxB [Halomonas sp. SS10-MC5]MCE8015815.1 4-phosphoerythronate dehydrogenase PdxB [Halomonas sp. MCCC 1A17488]MCG3239148.1 4-phosphoerythronate dehydrogenase PdxB [Halomonas sp. MCCC 1A17488]QPP50909.1 4-phosphoerythronate dehydrogenase PdxB [Halomonas sp. SS10-MC5]